MRFIESTRKASNIYRWAFTIFMGIYGLIVLSESYSLNGLPQEWRISVGVSAFAFILLSLLTLLPPSQLWFGIQNRYWIIGILIVAGGIAFLMAWYVKAEWMRSILLEAGMASIFVAGVDLLFESSLEKVSYWEHLDRQEWDEKVLVIGFIFNLSSYQFWAMKQMLNQVTAETLRNDAARILTLFDFARKASNLPPELDITKQTEWMDREQIRREFALLELVAVYAVDHKLTNNEFTYLLSAATVYSDPEWRKENVVPQQMLGMWIENAIEQIVRHRKKRLQQLTSLGKPYDPLHALDEMIEYNLAHPGMSLPPLRDQTAGEANHS